MTTGNPESSRNFGLDDHLDHATRYRRAREFYDVVTGLWDSFADDAFVRDQDSGLFFDPEKMHVLNHAGEFFKVRGPLNVARPVQGWPVIVQAGASDAGRQLAAETAEMVFGAGGPLEAAKEFYTDLKGRMRNIGRNLEHLKILPGALVIVGGTREKAQTKRRLVDSLVHPDSGLASLSIMLGVDAANFELDAPLPEIPETNASKSARERIIDIARRENLTVRQLAERAGSYGGNAFVGTARDIADQMEEWLLADAADGFNLMFHTVPSGLEEFVDQVIPELQNRGLFRREYQGTTLRAHLGLPRPPNRFFS